MLWTSLSERKARAKKTAREDRLSEWHPHFAWFPTKVGEDPKDRAPIMAWMMWIERKVKFYPTRWVNFKRRQAFSYSTYRRKGYNH